MQADILNSILELELLVTNHKNCHTRSAIGNQNAKHLDELMDCEPFASSKGFAAPEVSHQRARGEQQTEGESHQDCVEVFEGEVAANHHITSAEIDFDLVETNHQG